MGGRRWKRANTVKDSMGMAIAKPLYSERSKIEVECQGIEVERLHGGKSGSGWTIGAAWFGLFQTDTQLLHSAKDRCRIKGWGRSGRPSFAARNSPAD